MIRQLLYRFPRIYMWLRSLRQRLKGGPDLTHPVMMHEELDRVAEVLTSPSWNICYGKGLMHERLEESFAEYVGVKHAVAVNTGCMALMMSKRALGLKPGDEVIHQVDTCVANSFAAINAGVTPVFADIDADTLMMSAETVKAQISPQTKAIIPIHMWGVSQNMDELNAVAAEHNLYVIEDSCLALGSEWKGKRAGSMGHVGVFSFGCLKPIQTGEGGMITTNDEALARELRTIRSYGDKTWEYGVRDNAVLSWNGRISEVLAAVGFEQLKGYDTLMEEMKENVQLFESFLSGVDGIRLQRNEYRMAYTQVSIQIDTTKWSKQQLWDSLKKQGIAVWHANFEPINTLAYFKEGHWKDWLVKGDVQRLEHNYNHRFPNSYRVYEESGLGIAKQHFISKANVLDLIGKFQKTIS